MRVCLVKYVCPESNEYKWLDECLPFDAATRLCKQLAKDGRRPILYRMTVNPSWLILQAKDCHETSRFSSVL